MELGVVNRRASGGFSLIELLIAAAILVVVVLALLPLFATSLSQNLAGRELSVATSHGRSQIEELTQLPLDRRELMVPAGADERRDRELFDPVLHRYSAATPADPSPWSRTTTVRQFNVRDLYDNGRLTTPLDGSTPAPHVHLREVIVEVESEREAGALGGGREVAMTTVRGF
ncbi:MAG TPA: prepilin-type N-terminal cleavage/methylation domain-containing protein [Thermoanaerobaculia bacterium]|nr:prepilin-type N-terminal cleavage/methylation domain-containing protein [Thermoanaerobaculia bacterium]